MIKTDCHLNILRCVAQELNLHLRVAGVPFGREVVLRVVPRGIEIRGHLWSDGAITLYVYEQGPYHDLETRVRNAVAVELERSKNTTKLAQKLFSRKTYPDPCTCF